MSEQAVLVVLNLSDDEYGTTEEVSQIHDLCDELESLIDDQNAGELDGDEFGDGKCTIFMYGPNADTLFAVVETILRSSLLAKGGHVIKRYGGPEEADIEEFRIEL